MSTITQSITQFDQNQKAVEGQAHSVFRTNANYSWSFLANFASEMGNFIPQANSLKDYVVGIKNDTETIKNDGIEEINSIKNIAVNSKDIAIQKALDAQNSALSAQENANIATQKAEEIQGYQYPTGLSYTPQEVDNKIQNKSLESFLGFNF